MKKNSQNINLDASESTANFGDLKTKILITKLHDKHEFNEYYKVFLKIIINENGFNYDLIFKDCIAPETESKIKKVLDGVGSEGYNIIKKTVNIMRKVDDYVDEKTKLLITKLKGNHEFDDYYYDFIIICINMYGFDYGIVSYDCNAKETESDIKPAMDYIGSKGYGIIKETINSIDSIKKDNMKRFDDIPDDVLRCYFFPFLRIPELLSCIVVCERWNKFFPKRQNLKNNNPLWRVVEYSNLVNESINSKDNINLSHLFKTLKLKDDINIFGDDTDILDKCGRLFTKMICEMSLEEICLRYSSLRVASIAGKKITMIYSFYPSSSSSSRDYDRLRYNVRMFAKQINDFFPGIDCGIIDKTTIIASRFTINTDIYDFTMEVEMKFKCFVTKVLPVMGGYDKRPSAQLETNLPMIREEISKLQLRC